MSSSSPQTATDLQMLKSVLGILSPAERRRLLFMTPAVMLMALMETAGVASIVPFLALLSDPHALDDSPRLHKLFVLGGFESQQGFFFFVGLGVLVLVTVGNTVSATTTWALQRFSWMGNHTLSLRMLEGYLRRPYDFFLLQNTADLGKNILSEVQAVVAGVLVQGVQLAARFSVVLLVTATLFLLDPVMAVGVAIGFGGIYSALYLFVRRTISLRGQVRVAANQQRFKLAAEALGGIKEVKLYGLESAVLAQFEGPSRTFASLQASNAVLGNLPKFAIETIAFGGVLAMVLYLLGDGRDLTALMPVLGLYAFAAYRLLPGLQVIFSGINSIRFNLGAVEVLRKDLEEAERTPGPAPDGAVEELPFREALQLDNVAFRYAEASRPAVAGVNLTIRPGEWVALVGPTGSGKSTLVDLALGLVQPTEGVVRVDNRIVDVANRRSLQRHAAYVPQQIFLIDDTVARNICFGIPESEVNPERLRWAARVAQIADFVETELPQQYDAPIGERGVRVSGGQRQRIGIARALYRQPRFLVLDEATSALDNATEAAFFLALRSELKDVAVVSIAHRLTTTSTFDRIYVIDRGQIVDVGTFNELRERNAHFRQVDAQAA
ncbi:MAG: ABC transporter ATP-binding protein [Deltaproteobacteria bacterium]|nr:ABC transporter ATP-binding protein [Deltaproteobacteria bacterium]